MQAENIEKNKMKLTFSADAAVFKKGIQFAYNKSKNDFQIAGFRKGKAPQKMIEAQFGREIFFEEAINHVLGPAYEAAAEESGLDIVSRPEIDVKSVSLETGVVFTAEVYTKPEVAVADYMGVPYTKTDTAVTDAEIDAEVDAARKQNARLIDVSDRAAQAGDTVTIDFKGFADGVAFPGGEGKDYTLVLGSNTFIPGFESQIIGRAIADDFEVNVTFPAEYHAEDLRGAEAVFQVELKEIQAEELPEADDEFAQDVSEFDTLAAYRASIAETLEARKLAESTRNKEEQVLATIVERAEMDVPGIMIDTQAQELYGDYERRVRRLGISPEKYMEIIGQPPDAIRAAIRADAEKQVKSRLALEAIAKAEQLAATDEELDAEITQMAESYKMEREQLARAIGGKERASLKVDICVRKALDMIMDAAIEAEASQP